MGVKRALVVDDSKVARTVLARMLEKQGVAVDTSESAEAALDYLLANRPDVIFLDHIMPGMDGFQAMQLIKQNPQTAAIPIMMYTSKEGETYVGQARALGAMGCLPKQVKPADVTEVLQRLGRMQPLREVAQGDGLIRHAVNDAASAHVETESERLDALRERVEDALRPAETEAVQVAMRRYHGENGAMFKQQDEDNPDWAVRSEWSAYPDVSAVHDTKNDDLTLNIPPAAARRKVAAKARISAGRYSLMLAVLVLPSLVMMKLYFDADSERDMLAREYQNLTEQQEILQAGMQRNRTQRDALDERYEAALGSLSAQQVQAQREREKLLNLLAWAVNEQSSLAYGQALLDNDALLRMRTLLSRLDELGVAGTLQIRRHHGRFCLSGSDASGYAKAVDALPLGECSIPQGERPNGTDPKSLELILNNELAAQGSRLRVEVTDLGYEQPRQHYPQPSSVQTAGDWNRIAQLNNRLEIAIVSDATEQAAVAAERSAKIDLQTY